MNIFTGVRWSRVAFLLLAATTLLLLSKYVLCGLWETAAHEVGFALLVSAVVWTLLEAQLRQESDELWDRRIQQATRNVFQAVLRKDLPKSLLDEANNLVLNSNLIRSNFAVTYTLIDSTFELGTGEKAECVVVEAVMEFQMRNIGTDTVAWNAGLRLPNPIHPGLKSKVEVRRINITKGAEIVQIDMEGGKRVFQEELADNRLTAVSFDVGEVTLQPGETCSFVAAYVMAKEAEDTELLQTLHPADGLRVTIFDQCVDGRRVTFARSVHRNPIVPLASEDGSIAKIFIIPGYLLPHQGVLIWWKRSPEPLGAPIAKAKNEC